jgi:putative MATE family efflux protein
MAEGQNRYDFIDGSIYPAMVRFAVPIIIALLLQTMYGAVDMLVVGRFCTKADVSAVSTGTWILQMLTVVVIGLSAGTTIQLGQKIGERKLNVATSIISSSVCFFMSIGIIVSLAMQFLAVPCAEIMQAPPEAFNATVTYVKICSAGFIFITAYNLLGSIFKGMGDSTIPLIAVAIACVINIFGDLLLVAVFDMGVAGAAIATIFAQAVSVLLSAIIIKRRGSITNFTKGSRRFNKNILVAILKIGFPIAFQDFLVGVSFLAISAIVNTLGVTASAGVGIAEKICGFIMLVPSAFAQTIGAFVAQNVGARRIDRARKALRYGIMTSFAVGIFFAYLSFFHGDLLASVFAKGKVEVITAAADYLKAYAIDCLLVSFMFCFVGFFMGCGKTSFVMWQGIIGAFGARIPVSYSMSRIKPVSLFKVGLATPCSTVIQIILCVAYFISMKKRFDPDTAKQMQL